MRTVIVILLTAILTAAAASILGCKSDTTAASQGEAIVSGVVTDASAGVPLSGATVQALVAEGEDQAKSTDAKGYYTFTFKVDSMAVVTLVFKKTGYRDTSFAVNIRSGSSILRDVAWSPVSVVVPPGGAGGSGLAQTIAFLGTQVPKVSVYGVGGKETSILDWEVRDSLGLPIDASHAVALSFAIMSGPGGGEFVSPVNVTTNVAGQAHMTFTAGIKSGVVQILATGTVPGTGRALTSGPIRMVIVGGYPDQAHFTIATQRFNFPALGIANLRNAISVLVGDKYSNPAAPSAVYFRSSAGVMQGSTSAITTNDDGQGTADLISGNPAPLGIYAANPPGDGYHYVVARTNGQNGVPVTDSLLMLWSGRGSISGITPTTFNIPNAGSQTITFRVADYLGHPLAAGTKISVLASIPPPPTEGWKQNQVSVTFGVSGGVELGDNIFPGPGTTDFSILLRDGSWDIIDSVGTPVNLSIAVTGPNVTNSLVSVISGVVH